MWKAPAIALRYLQQRVLTFRPQTDLTAYADAYGYIDGKHHPASNFRKREV